MTPPEFTTEFKSLMRSAMSARIPVGHIVLTLEMAKMELGFMHCMAIQQQQAHTVAQQIATNAPKTVKPYN